jgi:hypothetical protein
LSGADHLDDVTEQRSVLPGARWIQFDLTDEEVSALRKLLADAIDYDRYPLSLRVQALRYILAKFGPLAPRPPTPTPQEPGLRSDRHESGGAARGRFLCTHLGKPLVSCLCWHARCDDGRFQQAGAPLLAQQIAVAANGNDVAMMEEAVEDRSCHDCVAEHGAMP